MTHLVSDYLIFYPMLTISLAVHFLADFQLQSPKMAEAKKTTIKGLVHHLLIVGLSYLLLSIFFQKYAVYFLGVGLAHVLLDSTKFFFTKNKKGSQSVKATYHWERNAFLIDQTLHLMAIIGLYFLIVGDNPLPTNFYQIPSFLLFFILITKPINILFKVLFAKYQPDNLKSFKTKETKEEESIRGAGATIGSLERIAMGILIILGQFAAIGLVFTAKSIARYNKISESPAFAEYYLIGSLYSIISVLVISWICFGI